jgi:hypothetical protein
MHNTEANELDEWEQNLEVKLVELNECQTSKQFDTCSKCSEFFECNIRKSYIKAVYESMNKGSAGGFEF